MHSPLDVKFMLAIFLVFILMLFLQVKLLEAQIASFRKQGIDGRDEHSEGRQTTESAVRYKLKKRIIQLQEEYAQLDDRFKQVGS